MAELEKCDFYRNGKTSRGDMTVSWCGLAGSDKGCFGYYEACPTKEQFKPATGIQPRLKYSEPPRTPKADARKKVMLIASGIVS